MLQHWTVYIWLCFRADKRGLPPLYYDKHTTFIPSCLGQFQSKTWEDDCSNTGNQRLSAEQLHLPFFPRELDQWMRSLNSTLTRLLHHKQEVLHHHQHHNNAVQLLAYAHRAVSRHGDYYSEWHKILPAALNNINTKNIRRDSWDYLTLNGDKSRHVSTFASCF